MQLSGLNKLLSQLDQLKKKYWEGQPPEVVVGYTQVYALAVHETQRVYRKPGSKWKYLTDPARRLSNDGTLKELIVEAVKARKKLNLGLLRAGERVQRESQDEVPVDTSALRASAFTAFKEEVEGKARAAFDLSEAIKTGARQKKSK